MTFYDFINVVIKNDIQNHNGSGRDILFSRPHANGLFPVDIYSESFFARS
jgi:hypothetical protein